MSKAWQGGIKNRFGRATDFGLAKSVLLAADRRGGLNTMGRKAGWYLNRPTAIPAILVDLDGPACPGFLRG